MGEKAWHAAWAERPRLLAIARRRSLSRSDAEEAVGEAIVRCVTHPGLRPESLPAMLTAVTMRLCVDRLRERAMAERHAHRLVTRSDDQAEDVLDRAEALWLTAEMCRLGDRERAALTARMLGLTVQETAEALGVTYKSAESALDRAKRKMRAVWTKTLALLPLRRRPRAAVVVVVAASVVTSLAVCRTWRHDHAPGPVVVERAQVVRTGGASHKGSSAKAHPKGAPPVRLTVPEHRRASSTPPTRLSTPDLRVGKAHFPPNVVTLDPDPVGQLQECLRNGVYVETNNRVGVICREGPGA